MVHAAGTLHVKVKLAKIPLSASSKCLHADAEDNGKEDRSH